MYITGVRPSRKKKGAKLIDLIDRYVDLMRTENEVQLWMEKQVARCKDRGDDDMARWYYYKAWEYFERR